jgi:LmbE family N-acetylglucosaminyl deacetylase
MAMSRLDGKYNLVCVAHPDDETIFFGGLLLQQKKNSPPWLVICSTTDGSQKRKRQFMKACSILGVAETQWWGFQDRYEQRLPIEQLVKRLQALHPPHEIYTHGIVGEYGHPHHQDVSYAVHKAFQGHPRLYSLAYNSFPEKEIKLKPKDFEVKSRILTKVYGSETNRFLNVLPSTFVEGFCRLDMKEVEAVYDYLARGKNLRSGSLKTTKWLKDYLQHLRDLPRPF